MNTGQTIAGSNAKMNRIQPLIKGSHKIEGETGQQI